MFANYKLQVLQNYREKKAANLLSLRLTLPTPGKLKEECMTVCEARYRRKDGKALQDFFGEGDDKALCLQAIAKLDTDKFKPLANYLKESTNDTEDKNVELLAWLIDFEHRPYEWGKKYESLSPEKPGIIEEPGIKEEPDIKEKPDIEPKEPTKNRKEPEPKDDPPPPPLKFKTRHPIIIAGILLIAIGVLIYWLGNKSSGPQACMYWTGDHYQQIPCNGKPPIAAQVIALDPEKLNNFRRITHPDTITQLSWGFVWYAKVNDTMEFYTSQGYHPINTWLRLKPISDNIIKKLHHPVPDSAQASR